MLGNQEMSLLTRMTVIWPTSRKCQQGKKEGYYRTPDYRMGNRPHTAKFKVVRNLHRTLSIRISKTKLPVKIESESERF